MNYLKRFLKRKPDEQLGEILKELQKLSADSIQVRKNQREIDDKLAEINSRIRKWVSEN